jgi:hypothetical protein
VILKGYRFPIFCSGKISLRVSRSPEQLQA